MRIASIEIKNFRSLKQVEITFDNVTTFIGPNGSGKSSILRALDWFFNGTKGQLTDDDVYAGARETDNKIWVRVTFDQLSDADRDSLGPKYAPVGVDTFTAWRTWDGESDKMTGKARAFSAFEAVRTAEGASSKKAALSEAQAARPDLELPKWTTIGGTESAMDVWEREHPGQLEDAVVSDSHFFGFNGQNKLSGLFDYVMVSADLRAAEESRDSRDTIVGRILERAIDRTKANEALADLLTGFNEQQSIIHQTHLVAQLEELAIELTAEVGSFTSGRSIRLVPAVIDVKPPAPRIDVSVVDAEVTTKVTHQGHGFQRALLLSALKLLARRGSQQDQPGVICLAIEEPELYQHPTQAKVFASVLRQLAQDQGSNIQITYATHSPYFVEPRYFDQIRRVTRTRFKEGHAEVVVRSASIEAVCSRLAGFDDERSVRSRWDQVCLKSLPEAFFADAAILVEGEGDKAVLEGAAGQTANLALRGIAVSATHGKTKMLVPYVILEQLGIVALIVFDNDSGCRGRMQSDGRDKFDIGNIVLNTIDQNHKLLKFFDLEGTDFPEGILSSQLIAIPDTMEAMIKKDWPEWESTRDVIVGEGRGTGGKNAATYALVSEECSSSPSGTLSDILAALVAIRV